MDNETLDLKGLTYDDKIEELKNFYIEMMTTYRMLRFKIAHEIGKAINEKELEIEDVMVSIRKNFKSVAEYLDFAKEFPNLNEAPITKNQSWKDFKKRYEKDKEEKSPFRIKELIEYIEQRQTKNIAENATREAQEDSIIIERAKQK